MTLHAGKTAGVIFLAAAVTVISMVNAGWAAGTINGQGSVVLSAKPTKVLMFTELTGQGDTLAAAMEQLDQRFRSAAAKLETLKADRDSIRLDAPTATPGPAPRAATTRTVIYRSSGTPTLAPAAPSFTPPPSISAPSITVTPTMVTEMVQGAVGPMTSQPPAHHASATLVASWSLGESDPRKAMLFVGELTEKLKAADLAGEKEPAKDEAADAKKKLSEAEQEVLDEMQAAGPVVSSSVSVVGTEESPFLFAYVGQITPAERQAALRKAFELARTSAEELAQAAQVRLGPLALLHESRDFFDMVHRGAVFSSTQSPQMRLDQALRRRQTDGAGRGEVLGTSLDELTQQIGVTAMFKIAE